MMKKILAYVLALLLLFQAFALSETTILADGWQNASIEELKLAASMIEQTIADKKEALKEELAQETGVFFSEGGVSLRFDGMEDTHTSGLNFHPAIYFDNTSDKALNVSASDFYVNGFQMSVSNTGAIKLDPKTSLMLTTRNSWLLSAEDLIDTYGVGTIESFSVKLTIKLGDETIADKQQFSFRTSIDIFEMMGENSYFTRKYPKNFRPAPLNTDNMLPLFDREGVRIFYNGMEDTHTSGMDFHPAMYFENNTDEVLSVSASDYCINGILMSVSNTGDITLDPHTSLMLSTKYVWLLSSEDLIDVYGVSTIENFSVKLTIKLGGRKLTDQAPFSIQEHADIMEIMKTNSYFSDKYPYGYEVQPIDLSEMTPVYTSSGVEIYFRGFEDTHTSGLDFQPDMYFVNNTEETLSINATNFIIDGIPMSVSNSGAITLEPFTRLMLATRYSWLISSEDLITVYGVGTIKNFSVDLTIKLNDRAIADPLKFFSDQEYDLFELMSGNSYFTKEYPSDYTLTPLDLTFMHSVFESDGIRILFDGMADTHTSGLTFQPALYIENTTDYTITITPSDFYINSHLMSVSNSGSISLPPKTRIMLNTRYLWLIKAADLIDVYECSLIDTFEVKLTIKQGEKVLKDKMPVYIDTDIDIYELMSGNSYFTKKYQK